MSLKELKDVTYYDLNNEINIPVNGQIPLNKDQEALQAFLTQNVEPTKNLLRCKTASLTYWTTITLNLASIISTTLILFNHYTTI